MRVLHLASPALPIGAFHFSQGLEYAVEARWVNDERTASDWIGGLAHESIGTLDLPVIARLRRAYLNCDDAAIRHWSLCVLASRETAELRAEDRHTGQALARILRDLGVITREVSEERELASYPAMFARACAAWSIAETEALQTYAWTWQRTKRSPQ